MAMAAWPHGRMGRCPPFGGQLDRFRLELAAEFLSRDQLEEFVLLVYVARHA